MKRKATASARGSQPIILIDMDDTIAAFTSRALDLLAQRHPHVPLPDVNHTTFPLANSFAAEHKPLVMALFMEPGFFSEMEPIPGAVAALHSMVEAGYDVRICSSPLASSPRCLAEKAEWIMQHLGRQWIDRLVLTRDKTIVRGSILIDDAPTAKGNALTPSWTHVYFAQPHNAKGAPGVDPLRYRIEAWADWRSVLSNVFSEIPSGSGRNAFD